MFFNKTDEIIARAMILWLGNAHGMTAEVAAQLVRRKGRGWEVRGDWMTLFVATSEYQAAHVARQEGDPFIKDVRAALAKLGNPAVFLLSQLDTPHIYGRRIHAVLGYLGYEPNPNPQERQGRWYRAGKQTRGYRAKG
jgi:hypothetical protein